MKLHQRHVLSDGRTLSYSDIGEPTDYPVLYFHGFPGSRLEAAFAEQTILQCRVRVISVERPGYGQSSHNPHREIRDWPDDIEQLANALGLTRFSVLGMSTGGGYALACAHALPGRVHSTGIAGTLAPMDDPVVLEDMNWVARLAFRFIGKESIWARLIVGRLLGYLIRQYAGLVVKAIKPTLCQFDREVLEDESFHREFTRSIREAYQNGYHGPLHDLALVARPWGFAPEEIHGTVHLWHGQRDSVVPHSMGQHLALRLHNCHTSFPQDEGHFSIIANYMQWALLTLKAEQVQAANIKETT